MDSDRLQTAGRLTAALIPRLDLDTSGDDAAKQVASMYWSVVRELVEGRKNASESAPRAKP